MELRRKPLSAPLDPANRQNHRRRVIAVAIYGVACFCHSGAQSGVFTGVEVALKPGKVAARNFQTNTVPGFEKHCWLPKDRCEADNSRGIHEPGTLRRGNPSPKGNSSCLTRPQS